MKDRANITITDTWKSLISFRVACVHLTLAPILKVKVKDIKIITVNIS